MEVTYYRLSYSYHSLLWWPVFQAIDLSNNLCQMDSLLEPYEKKLETSSFGSNSSGSSMKSMYMRGELVAEVSADIISVRSDSAV